MIYFAQAESGGAVKIGTTGNLKVRLSQIKVEFHPSMKYIATMEGDRKKEAEIHGRFSHLRLDDTEQFRPTLELMEFIGQPSLASENPDAVEAIPYRYAHHVTLINLKGSIEYRRWLEEISKDTGLSPSEIAFEALEMWAEQRGLPAPPWAKRDAQPKGRTRKP